MVSFDRPPVLFGDNLTAASHPRLATKLIPYDQLKQTLRRLDPDSDSHSAIEGIFLTQLLSAINQACGYPLCPKTRAFHPTEERETEAATARRAAMPVVLCETHPTPQGV